MTKHQFGRSSSVMKSIAVLGAAKTGKTSLIARFLGQPFEERRERTVEDYYFGKFYVGETLYNMKITDTSGSFEFPAMERLTMQKADAFIFVYSLEDERSFEQVKMCLKRLSEVKDINCVPIIVVCNKADLANIVSLRNMQMRWNNEDMPVQCTTYQRDVCREQNTCTKEKMLCTQWEHVRELGCEFLLTSAKYRWNVNRIFENLFTERTKTDSEKSCSNRTTFNALKWKVMRKKC